MYAHGIVMRIYLNSDQIILRESKQTKKTALIIGVLLTLKMLLPHFPANLANGSNAKDSPSSKSNLTFNCINIERVIQVLRS